MTNKAPSFSANEAGISELVRHAVLHDAPASQLDTALSEKYIAALDLVWKKAGDIVMHQDEPSDRLATVVLGRVKVVQEDAAGKKKTLITLGHGETVGEMGLVTGQPRSATVIAQRDTLLATLSSSAFEQLLEQDPLPFNKQFVRPIINRLQDQIKGITKANVSLLTMMLVPASDSVDVASLANKLAETLNKGIASCLHIDKQFLSTNFGNLDEADAEQDRQISEWLGIQEVQHDVVIYTAETADSIWLQRCLRQSDKLVIVGDGMMAAKTADSLPTLTLPEAASQERHLLLLQPNRQQQPQGTRAWLDSLDVKYFYHLCPDSAENLASVGRLLANRGIGFVFRGSGARGAAHVGATQFLRERGVPFDVVCGASSGTVISTCIAHGMDMAEFKKHFVRPPKLQYTIPFSAISTGFGFQKWFDSMFGDLNLEDIWMPNFFPIYNLRTNALEICDRGRASNYLRAATALPGLAPPYIVGEDIYLDAGVMNFMPIDLLRARSDIQTVIAVDIHSPVLNKKPRPYTYDGRLSGWKVLLNRLNPFAKGPRFVSIVRILLSSMFAGGVHANRQHKDMADFRINLVVTEEDIGMFEFDKLEQGAQYGYDEAKRQFADSGLEAFFSKKISA